MRQEGAGWSRSASHNWSERRVQQWAESRAQTSPLLAPPDAWSEKAAMSAEVVHFSHIDPAESQAAMARVSEDFVREHRNRLPRGLLPRGARQ